MRAMESAPIQSEIAFLRSIKKIPFILFYPNQITPKIKNDGSNRFAREFIVPGPYQRTNRLRCLDLYDA
jgi:hypothetical protein